MCDQFWFWAFFALMVLFNVPYVHRHTDIQTVESNAVLGLIMFMICNCKIYSIETPLLVSSRMTPQSPLKWPWEIAMRNYVETKRSLLGLDRAPFGRWANMENMPNKIKRRPNFLSTTAISLTWDPPHWVDQSPDQAQCPPNQHHRDRLSLS